MILFSHAIASGAGRISYVAGSMTPIGNDGLHHNDSINGMPNNSAPDSVVNALYFASNHLPLTAKFVFPTGPVPIQLAGFAGVVVGSNRVRPDWRTISKLNNFGFEIQRQQPGSEFATLANSFVPGHGTTLDPHDYWFIDSTASADPWLYRLKQIDPDGTVHYTHPIRVDLLTSVAQLFPKEYSLSQNFPNPFNPSATIEYGIPSKERVTLKIYDLLGREVAILVDGVEQPGYKSVRWDASGLSSGVYR